MNDDLAEYALDYAEKAGVRYAEVRMEQTKGHTIIIKNGNPETATLESGQGLSVRVSDGGIGFSSTNVLNKKHVGEVVERAARMARASGEQNRISWSSEDVVEDRWEVKPKIDPAEVSLDEKLEALGSIEEALKDLDVPMRLYELSDETTEKYLTTSEGTRIRSITPRVSFFYVLTVREGCDTEQTMLEKGQVGGWEVMAEWDLPERTRTEAKMLSKLLKHGTKPPSGKVDVVLGPQVTGIAVHESCGHPYEADRIAGREAAQAGESFITPDMLGQVIGSDVVNVIDDPTLPHSYGYYLYDDEGVKARPRYLIKDGRINEFLHNRETAAEAGIRSNAAARALDYDREPIVRMANTYMAPKDYPLEELIDTVSLGVYMVSYTEWNIDDKRFNQRYVGKEAYLIDHGEIKGMVRRPALELTTPSFYGSIDAVGKDVKFFAGDCGKGDPMQAIPVWMGGPPIRLRGVELG